MNWKDWAGYYAVASYDTNHDQEYFAYRHAAGLMDATPLFKYEVKGPDSLNLLSRIMAKDIGKLRLGRVTYCCWCDDDGKILDDGTVARLGMDHFRVTAAEPFLHWFLQNARTLNVTIEDITAKFGILALQGPLSREILVHAAGGEVATLRFFRLIETRIDGRNVTITRTGYTGDLGYEIWCGNSDAIAVYDALIESGKNYQIMPAGLAALDVARIEAGFIMNGVDYFSANHCLIDSQKSTPYELGLGWSVNLERDCFIGQKALQAEKETGSSWQFVGLEYDWEAFEEIFARFDLPPQTHSGAWRTAVPVYGRSGKQVGQATSGAWSPTLKKNLALASLRNDDYSKGDALFIEVTAEYERKRCPVRVSDPMFFNPERKRGK
ncbi:MAG: aminomethyltransferase family protein [Acidobacteriota bacterium]|nr:aminomethyltransferase family protein [Acidobacteriota bacterium]MDH3529307.1 aminomethyltransferase family protein [Acidobacteriota bacterium]